MLNIKNICARSWGANCYAVISDGHAVIIDPSASAEAIVKAVSDEGAIIDGILLTHGHFDHIISLDTLRDSAQVPASVHESDAVMLTDGKKNAFFEFFGRERIYRPAEKLLKDGDTVNVGSDLLRVIHTPGHTPGSVCFLGDGVLFTGDTLFAESFGRCDLWGGDSNAMSASLAKLRTLNGSMRIYPGHGETAILSNALDNVAYL